MTSANFIGLGVVAVLILGMIIWIYRDIQKKGKLSAQAKEHEDAMDRVKKADEARRRVKSDPEYRKRLRDKYTRR